MGGNANLVLKSKLTLCTNGCVSVDGVEDHVHSEADALGKNGNSKNSANCTG